MTDWININLPWSTSTLDNLDTAPILPNPPNLSKRTKKIFGTTLDIEWDNISNEEHKEEEKYRERIGFAYTTPELDDELLKRYGHKKSVAKIVAYRQLLRTIREWEKIQPEYIAFQQKLQEFNQTENQKSFTGKGLNQPGTLIIVDDQQYLIGDINTLRGVCDDCTAFQPNAIVQRYKIVWKEEK